MGRLQEILSDARKSFTSYEEAIVAAWELGFQQGSQGAEKRSTDTYGVTSVEGKITREGCGLGIREYGTGEFFRIVQSGAFQEGRPYSWDLLSDMVGKRVQAEGYVKFVAHEPSQLIISRLPSVLPKIGMS